MAFTRDNINTIVFDIKEMAHFLTVACNVSTECDVAACPSKQIKGLPCPNEQASWCQRLVDNDWLEVLRDYELLRVYEKQQQATDASST